MDLEKLREQIDSVSTNLTIYLNDVKRFTKRLMEEFGITEEELDDRVDEIEEKIGKLKKKKRKIQKEIEEELDELDE